MTTPVVSVTETSTPVTVTIAGVQVATTGTGWRLSEQGLPDRWYLPREAVDWDRFEATSTSTHCPRKGDAVYWSFRADDGTTVDDVVWAYPDPIAAVPEIAGLVAFYAERPEVSQIVGEP